MSDRLMPDLTDRSAPLPAGTGAAAPCGPVTDPATTPAATRAAASATMRVAGSDVPDEARLDRLFRGLPGQGRLHPLRALIVAYRRGGPR